MKDLKHEFQQLKADYTKKAQDSNDIIRKMQDNLKKRTKESIITGLDGKNYQINSDNVEDLYAIDGTLSARDSSENMTNVGNVSREALQKNNKYSPSNPYKGE